MKPSNREIEDIVTEVAGKDVVPLVKLLKNRKNVSELKLAEQMDQEINETRTLLYKLYHSNLVSFTRKKDKKKGWYIYYWTFNRKRVWSLKKIINKDKIERLKERVKREAQTFYFSCPDACVRLDFEQSVGFEFKCPECGKLMLQDDQNKSIEELSKQIKFLENRFN